MYALLGPINTFLVQYTGPRLPLQFDHNDLDSPEFHFRVATLTGQCILRADERRLSPLSDRPHNVPFIVEGTTQTLFTAASQESTCVLCECGYHTRVLDSNGLELATLVSTHQPVVVRGTMVTGPAGIFVTPQRLQEFENEYDNSHHRNDSYFTACPSLWITLTSLFFVRVISAAVHLSFRV